MADEQILTDDQKNEISRTLEVLLSDSRFRTSERNKRFLAFIVENTLNGHSDRIKGYSIAVDVFGRDSSFDSAIDPIVRIEAGRLRAALAQYYEQFGAEHRVRIDIPKGAYRPQFIFGAAGPAAEPSAAAPAEPPGTGEPTKTAEHGSLFARLRRRFTLPRTNVRLAVYALLLIIGATSAAAVTVLAVQPGRVARTQPILILGAVDALDDQRQTVTHARTLSRSLAVAFGQFANLGLVEQPPGRPLHEVVAGEMRANRGATVYVLRVALRGEGRLQYYATLTNARTNETVWSERSPAPLPRDEQALAEDLVARRIAAIVGSTRGLVSTIERRGLSEPVASGAPCLLFAQGQSVTGAPADLVAARNCLERTVAETPEDAEALALLGQIGATEATLAARGGLGAYGIEIRQAAERAAQLAPHSAAAQAALLMVATQEGQEPRALAAADRLLDLAPDDPFYRGLAARHLFRLGLYDRARAVTDATIALVGAAETDRAILVLTAFREGRGAEVVRETGALPRHDMVLRLVEASILAHAGDVGTAGRTLDEIRRIAPRVLADPRGTLRAQRYRDGFVEQVIAGLKTAGLSVE